jgi:hypothetical protein
VSYIHWINCRERLSARWIWLSSSAWYTPLGSCPSASEPIASAPRAAKGHPSQTGAPALPFQRKADAHDGRARGRTQSHRHRHRRSDPDRLRAPWQQDGSAVPRGSRKCPANHHLIEMGAVPIEPDHFSPQQVAREEVHARPLLEQRRARLSESPIG